MAAPFPDTAETDAEGRTDGSAAILDLTAFDTRRIATRYTPELVVAWLRTSGGSLGERAMKNAAADLIEQQAGGRAS